MTVDARGPLPAAGAPPPVPPPRAVTADPGGPPRGGRTWRQAIAKDWRLYSLVVLPLVFLLVFRYLPMLGNVIAFRRFQPGGSVLGFARGTGPATAVTCRASHNDGETCGSQRCTSRSSPTARQPGHER